MQLQVFYSKTGKRIPFPFIPPRHTITFYHLFSKNDYHILHAKEIKMRMFKNGIFQGTLACFMISTLRVKFNPTTKFISINSSLIMRIFISVYYKHLSQVQNQQVFRFPYISALSTHQIFLIWSPSFQELNWTWKGICPQICLNQKTLNWFPAFMNMNLHPWGCWTG